MKKLPILTLTLLFFTSCHPTEEEIEILWKRHLEFKESKLSELRQSAEIDRKSSKAISLIDSIKSRINSESENLLEVEYSSFSLINDRTTTKPLLEMIHATKFSNSEYARIKYGQFGKRKGAADSWLLEFFNKRTAAEALLLLTDLQIEIINFDLTSQSENRELLEEKNQLIEELRTHN